MIDIWWKLSHSVNYSILRFVIRLIIEYVFNLNNKLYILSGEKFKIYLSLSIFRKIIFMRNNLFKINADKKQS